MIERDGNQVRITGALTMANAVTLCEAVKQHLSGDLVVDLAAVTEVDSAALSLLFEWRREARRRNAQVVFRGLPASLKSLATLYGVAELIGEHGA